jgi:hypothetical protein
MYDYQIDNVEILLSINQEECFLRYFPTLYGKLLSPLRDDKHAGTSFWVNDYGILLFVDFAINKRYDCIQFIMAKENVSKEKAIELLLNKYSDKKRKTQKLITRHIIDIQEEVRKFKSIDIKYWRQYGLKISDIKHKVKAISHLEIIYDTGEVKVNEVPELAYCIYNENCKKIYYPNQESCQKIFFGNCKKNDVWWNNEGNKNLIITKSFKDCMVIKKNIVNVDTLWFNSETTVPDNVCKYLSGYRNIIIFYDNDSTGIFHAKKLMHHIVKKCQKMCEIFTIPQEFKVKDISDFKAEYHNVKFIKLEILKLIEL